MPYVGGLKIIKIFVMKRLEMIMKVLSFVINKLLRLNGNIKN